MFTAAVLVSLGLYAVFQVRSRATGPPCADPRVSVAVLGKLESIAVLKCNDVSHRLGKRNTSTIPPTRLPSALTPMTFPTFVISKWASSFVSPRPAPSCSLFAALHPTLALPLRALSLLLPPSPVSRRSLRPARCPVLCSVPQRRALRQPLHDAQLVGDRGRDAVFRQLRWRVFQLLRGGDARVGERGGSQPCISVLSHSCHAPLYVRGVPDPDFSAST